MPAASRPIGRRRAPADVRVATPARIPLSSAGVARLASAVLAAERRGLAALSLAFVGPARIRALSRLHLGRDRVTDVIAFTLGEPGLVGDVYICPRVAAAHARGAGITLKAELRRLVVHGVLHVLGYDHAADAGRVRGPMWRRQERYLARYGRLAP